MRILADTNIFVKYWKTNDFKIGEILQNEDVVICGAVRAELMHGARSKKEMSRIQTLLAVFDEMEMTESDWVLVGDNLNRLRMRGLTVPFPDGIIATMGLKYKLPIWTNDRHFTGMSEILTGLALYAS